MVQRTIHFRAVSWFGQAEDLLSLVRSALQRRQTVASTAFNFHGQVCEVRHRRVRQDEIRLHLSLHIPGAHKGLRPNAGNDAEHDLTSAPPPNGSEYTERELAIVLRQSKVGYVAAGRAHGATVSRALSGLVALQHGAEVGNRLNLSARADPAAVQRMLAAGVDRFELGVSLSHVDAAQTVAGQPRSMSSAIGQAIVGGLSSSFLEDYDDDAIDELSNMEVSVSINARRGAPAAEIETLTALASQAVEEDEEFTIRTRNKATFTRDKLLLTSTYYDGGNAAMLTYDAAWERISQFLDTIQ
jgi:hypothetical protein